MNLILFRPEEAGRPIPENDARVRHVMEILRLEDGCPFQAGILGGMQGEAVLGAATAEGRMWSFTPGRESAPLRPLTLVLGCPRPPVAKRLLKDMSTLGIQEIRVCSTDLNENSYLTSRLWREGLWEKALMEGAVQGGSTLIPHVIRFGSLSEAMEDLPSQAVRFAPDNGKGACSYHAPLTGFGMSRAVLAIGPERGWSGMERDILDGAGFTRMRLGRRIMRTETTCSAAAMLLLAELGILEEES